MTNETLIVLCWELYEQRMPKTRIAQRLVRHRETVHLWIKGISGAGLIGFLDKYQQAQKQLDEATLTAPINGVIASADIEEGDSYRHTVP